MSIILLIALFALSIAADVTASPIVPQFYKVKVSLSDGRVIEGYSFGVGWMGGPRTQERAVSSVALKIENEKAVAAFTFPGENRPVICREHALDQEGKPLTLVISSDYEVFHKGIDFYWMKGVQEYPLADLIRLDTVQVIGPGLSIPDPKNYLNLKEPFILVEDCGLGCETKMYSKDPRVTKEMLEDLWNKHFKCSERSLLNQTERDRVGKLYRLEWITDPFCHD